MKKFFYLFSRLLSLSICLPILFLGSFSMSTLAAGRHHPVKETFQNYDSRVLSFSPSSLSYSVIQNGSTPNQSSTLSAGKRNPSVNLSKSSNSAWLILPSPKVGILSFAINATGLTPGTYTCTVKASAFFYTSASLKITLVVLKPDLSLSPATLSFSVVQNGNIASKSSTLSANSGAPNVTLSKSTNSNWLMLPSPTLGSLSFGINTSGLSPGTYISTVTANATGYNSATLQVTLTVTVAQALSFSPTALSYSVAQNGAVANKTSTLSANTGTPTVSLSRSANSTWLVLPAAALGSLSFGINASGLAPGTYNETVMATASGYASAGLNVTLTVTGNSSGSLSFSATSLAFSVQQNGTTATKSSTLSANTGTPAITLSKSANSNWLMLPAAKLGSLSFGINTAGLSPGTYSSLVNASATGYTSATCTIYLSINAIASGALLNIKINFQDSITVPPSGYLKDFGQPFNARTSLNQGTGNKYGWIKRLDYTPLDLTKNARKRSSPSDILLATLMHMQGGDIPTFTGTKTEGIWEIEAVNGKYDVTVSVGDDTQVDSKHSMNIEGVNAIAAFVPTSTVKFKSATVSVTVSDGRLTIDAIGGTNTKINWVIIQPGRPSVVSVNPPDKSVNVSEYTSISTNVLKLPNSGIDNATITSANVFLTDSATGAVVPSNVNGTGGGDAITLVPSSVLKLNTTYKFNVTAGVKDLTGSFFIPYTSTFKTASSSSGTPITAQFEKVNLLNATGRHTSLTVGPDGKLYALSNNGIIKRFTINADGTLSAPQLIYSLQDHYGTRTPRLAIGFAFDPSATATNLIAWISHDTYTFTNAPDWDGKLSKMSGDNLQTVTDVLINLPRSAKDHVTNSIAFGPDGSLYFTQGSTSAMGAADQTWSNRNEHLLNAAVLRLDLSKLGTLPLDVKTSDGGGTYNPYATSAPLTIYASGVRNAYDLVWHSNGSLYTPTNGSAAGGNTPASVSGTLRSDGTTYNGPAVPALTNVQQTQNDYLFRIVKGGYYGHPNPQRGEYVMNGGNPTSSTDKAEVTGYPVGTMPDVNWRGAAFDFKNNASPDGAIEYKSNTFNGALKGKLLVVRYSAHDDIITLTPGVSKDITSSTDGASIAGFSGFIDPLDLTEDVRNGNLYVSEYGGDSGTITLLRPTTVAGAAAIKSAPTANRPLATNNVRNTISGCDEGVQVILPSENTNLPLPNVQKPKINPNPVHKRFNIQFPGSYAGDYNLEIVDLIGRAYQVGKINLKTGGANMEIDISKLNLRPGIYLLKITSENRKTEVCKLFVE